MFRLEDVKTALAETGIAGMTVCEVRGFGRQRGRRETFRGVEYSIDFIPKPKLELVIPDRLVHEAVATIIEAARTGKVGDGKIFVSEIAEVFRIRTGEVGQHAI